MVSIWRKLKKRPTAMRIDDPSAVDNDLVRYLELSEKAVVEHDYEYVQLTLRLIDLVS
jgi:hypothetical protein